MKAPHIRKNAATVTEAIVVEETTEIRKASARPRKGFVKNR